ncbi:RNA polymerase-associated protein RTF1 [Colletotrichum sidae]|uniref:RNA polymerase-associated protein RTF1 n=1 Tax=Colletotrichum sidae TaxID=1347389 RepID=A0A4R8TG70_9PEZI|nr:RNA polymerase-associated protein RTF1 [Colletotrichum sidae]
MADIESELLALAGGGESSDEEEVMSESEGRAPSASPPKAAAKKSVAKRVKKHTGGEDSEEEGEASSAPGSPNSIGSAAMDESDSENEQHASRPAHDDDEEDKYPIDGMFRSRAEQEQVMAMREVERESLLAERQAEIERHRQNRMLRQLVSKQENEEKKQKLKKRSADAADLDDGSHKTSRPRTDGKTSAIDTLRRARAEKNDRARRREEDRQKGLRSPRDDDDHYGGRDESDVDEYDRDRRRRKSRSPEEEIVSRELPPVELGDFQCIRVGKSRLAEYCFNPGFETAIAGCYVRVSIGMINDVPDYRMARIKSVTVGKPYAMVGPGGSFVTDQHVLAAVGKAEKTFPFIFLSDGQFTEREYNRYQTTLSVEGIDLPKKQALLDKKAEVANFCDHHLTTYEIDDRIQRKAALRKKFDPKFRERLAQEIEKARFMGNDKKAEELQEQLDELKTHVLGYKTSLGDSSAKANPQQDRLADINRKRRLENAEAVRKAQLKEKADARRQDQAAGRGEEVGSDLSRRVKTNAKSVHDGDAAQKASANSSAAGTPAAGTPKVGAENSTTALPNLAKLQAKQQKKGIPTIHKPVMDDEVIASLDLGIDLDIDID